jgi:hypothetical protein
MAEGLCLVHTASCAAGRAPAAARRLRWVGEMPLRNGLERHVALACAVQLAVVAGLAGLGFAGVALAAAIGAALGGVAVRDALPRAPAATAMLALGGLGMTLGWCVDAGLSGAHALLDPLWCGSPAGPAGHGHVVSWMNAGMLALGLPAARLARPRCTPHPARTLVCAVAMVAGMAAGSRLAAGLAPALAASAAVALEYAAMLLGMGAGMAAAEAWPRLAPGTAVRARRAPPS